MTGEEYYNLKQGDRVIVTKSTPTFLGMKGTIYEMVYRDHYKEDIYLKCIQTIDNKYLELACVKIVDPATALQYINIYNGIENLSQFLNEPLEVLNEDLIKFENMKKGSGRNLFFPLFGIFTLS